MTKQIKRHSPIVRSVHWITVISTFVLIFTGIGQMPMYKRYKLAGVTGFSWTGDYEITLIIHYIAAAFLVFIAIYHIVFHYMRREFSIVPKSGDLKESYLIIKAMFGFGEEPKSEKYLAEQRVAYLYIVLSFFIIIATGMVKVIKNFEMFTISDSTMVIMTLFHNIGMIMILLGIVLHLVAFVFKDNRPLVPSMFTGFVNKEYAVHRHPYWVDELEDKNKLIIREK